MSGKIWKFSDQIDDWDVLFAGKEFITYREGCEYYSLSEKSMVRLARAAGAVYKIDGKMVRIRRDIFEAYLRSVYRIPENEQIVEQGKGKQTKESTEKEKQ